ncbi:tetratricopeptide repeat protein [Algoriphagus taiwanensis]|uniref:Tetratricopeptide repeat protein n=1 Tax=Algoriphagus taiwanensis TaxID=1445656 RepID=A0ABQ6Q0T3_9BACT|nr:hypothetical protein Ataiwa_14670 [Algoriphagus taiwanensis]
MDQNELFKNYLEGKLSSEDRLLFEKLLKENQAYQAELNQYKKQVSPAKKTRFRSWAVSFLIALGIVALGIFLVYSLASPPGTKLFSTYYQPLDVETWESLSIDPSIEKGVTAYKNGKYEEAKTLFEQMLASNSSPDVLFFLGLCHLALDRPEKAVPILSRIPKDSPLAGDAAWYEGLGYLKLNKLEKAKPLLLTASQNSTQFSPSAQEILGKLK